MGTINSIGPKATVWMLVWRSAFSPSTPKIRVRNQLAAYIFCRKRQNKGPKRPGLAHLKKTFNLSLFSIKDLGLYWNCLKLIDLPAQWGRRCTSRSPPGRQLWPPESPRRVRRHRAGSIRRTPAPDLSGSWCWRWQCHRCEGFRTSAHWRDPAWLEKYIAGLSWRGRGSRAV